MSVFFKNRLHKEPVMEDQKDLPCIPTHKWDGVIPTVNPDLMEVQNPDIMGKSCDCGRMVFNEEKCGCFIPKWEIKFLANG